MFNHELEPLDTCGCGAEGYLTTRNLPVDLIHGVGKLNNVPVYHCQTETCQEFNIPLEVSRRLDELAEQMEKTKSLTLNFCWETNNETSGAPLNQVSPATLLQAFTLRFRNREYEDTRVTQIIPSQAIFFQSSLDQTEYYVLNYLEDHATDGLWFSFMKCYYDGADFTYDTFLSIFEDGLTKELAILALDEIEDVLQEHFGISDNDISTF